MTRPRQSQLEKNQKRYQDLILPHVKGWRPKDTLIGYGGHWWIQRILEGALYAQEFFQARPNDFFICSYLKTDKGNTLFATHLPHDCLPDSVVKSGCKMGYIWRDPKDTFISLWLFFQKKRLESGPLNGIEESFDMFCQGRVLRRDLTALTNALASSPGRFDEDYNLKWFSESITIVDQSVHEQCSIVSDSVLDLSRGLLSNPHSKYRLRTETWGLEVQFDRESSVCEDSFIQSGDAKRASSPSITLCDVYSAIGDGGISLINGFPLLLAHAVMKHCRYSDCLCGVLSMSKGRTRKKDNRNFSCIVKTLVDAYIVVARDLVGTRLEVKEVHVLGVQLGKLCDVEQRQAYSCSCFYVGHYPSVPSLSIRNRTLRNYTTDHAYHWKENL
ncbi:hypothetical protein DY000_02012954 [Brassica cretica]|uniref:Sulfotransferase n=1 Tax=Brassica cretica TaxID=69181 RepID=A0ABQ7CQW6_BRACR|nr:hypothetical protein DY000_02012954 [Brassica cretica]